MLNLEQPLDPSIVDFNVFWVAVFSYQEREKWFKSSIFSLSLRQIFQSPTYAKFTNAVPTYAIFSWSMSKWGTFALLGSLEQPQKNDMDSKFFCENSTTKNIQNTYQFIWLICLFGRSAQKIWYIIKKKYLLGVCSPWLRLKIQLRFEEMLSTVSYMQRCFL